MNLNDPRIDERVRKTFIALVLAVRQLRAFAGVGLTSNERADLERAREEIEEMLR